MATEVNDLSILLLNEVEGDAFNNIKINQIFNSTDMLKPITSAVMKMRQDLRNFIVEKMHENRDTANSIAMDNIVMDKTEVYYKHLTNLYSVYFSAVELMSVFGKVVDIRVMEFLKFYNRYRELLTYITDDYYMDSLNDYDLRMSFYSSWSVYAFRVKQPLHTVFKMREIDEDSIIEETDWDGTKSMKGLHIIRRNGECDGVILSLLFIEEVDESKSREKKKKQILHFYSVSEDGKEYRHFPVSVVL